MKNLNNAKEITNKNNANRKIRELSIQDLMSNKQLFNVR